MPKLDAEFEEITEGEEQTKKETAQERSGPRSRRWWEIRNASRLVAAGPGCRILRKRLEAMDGKAMIVCMSRRIAVDLYNALHRTSS